jgi:hypothetical protein
VSGSTIRLKLTGELERFRGSPGHVDVFGPSTYAHLDLNEARECVYAFPGGGKYRLFASVVPKGEALRVAQAEIEIPGPAAPAEPEADAVQVNDYRVSMAVAPRPPADGVESHLTFDISRGGKPVADLEPFEGMSAMCVLIGDDGGGYEFAHPIAGPKLKFHADFAKPGRYRVWLTFRHAGRVVHAGLRVTVRGPSPLRRLDPGNR